MSNQMVTINLNALTKADQLPAYLQNLPSIVGTIPVGDTRNRLGLKGREFHIIRGGVEDGVTDTKYIDVIIVGAVTTVSRQFYAKRFVEGEGAAPNCYSADGVVPAADVKHPQHSKCNGCPQDAKGSSLNAEEGSKGRACGFFRRCAVLLPAFDDTPLIYQLDVKSMSLWGESDERNNRYSFQDYAKKLQAAGRDVGTIITRLHFTSASVPVLQFEPFAYVPQDRIPQIIELVETNAIAPVLDVTMATVDISELPPAEAAPQAAEPAAPVVVVQDKPTLRPTTVTAPAPATVAPPAAPATAATPRPVLRPTLRPAVAAPAPAAQPVPPRVVASTPVAAPAPAPAPSTGSSQEEIDALIAELAS